MGSANVDLVRSIFADWERGDFGWPESADAEMEFVVADGPEPGSRTGLAARPWAEGFLNVWERLRFEANEYRELDDGRVLVLYRIRGRGKGSGVELDQSRAGLFHIDKGKVSRVVFYWDSDRAFADLGLAPEGDPAASVGVRRAGVEIAAAAFEAFNRRDPEAFIRDGRLHADYEWRPFMTAGVEGGVYRGHDGVREWFAAVDEMFETFSAELSSVRDAGERVVVLGTLRGRGRGSGVAVESPLGIVLEMDPDGLARRGIAFTTHAEALAHAGLAAEAEAPD